jgi:hypothetical protein
VFGKAFDDMLEAVSHIYSGQKGEQPAIDLTGVEQGVISGLASSFTALSHYAVLSPYYLMLSLVGVRGFAAPMNDWGHAIAHPHRADRVLLPEILIKETEAARSLSAWLKPAVDLLWNALGQNRSPNYDRKGHYRAH